MSDVNYTPGEWYVYKPHNAIAGIESRAGVSVVVWGTSDDDAGVRGTTNEEALANARLMSAAPDLYEALQEIINTEWIGGKGGFVRARAALAKARGEQ
jgi:hypothetical protein